MMNTNVQPAWAAKLLKNLDMGAVATDIVHFEEDDNWLKENMPRFKKEFPGMFVAVYDKKLIGIGKALEDAQEKARSAGIDPSKCVIRLILTEDYIWVL